MTQNLLTIIDYTHLITTRPHDIQQVVISDLHLSKDEPVLVQAFLSLLDDLIVLPNLQKLFIAGDWFDAWIGDDAYLSLNETQLQTHWITPVIQQLKTLQQTGCRVLIMHGNRDFLLGQPFCDTFNGQLIDEPYTLKIGGQRFRLEHGDALCTDDTAYQRFRRVMRNPAVQWLLLRRPLDKRLKLANIVRQKSSANKAQKSQVIMDVNAQAVHKAMQNADALLHGHTHQPAIHQLSDNKMRYVLGDWRVLNKGSSRQQVTAVIGVSMVNHDANFLTQQSTTLLEGTIIDTQQSERTQRFSLVNYLY